MAKYIKLFIILALVHVSFGVAAQTYLEEPLHTQDGGLYVTKIGICSEYRARSFTYCYDTEKRIALWVAYPLNTALIGRGSRSETWLPDTDISIESQPVLYKGFARDSGYDRGHQIPSADRLYHLCNQQTFTFTNATPQLHDFNGGIWAELEKVVRTWAKRSDTLYVVTGVIPGNRTIDDNVGNPINIPAAYYKAVLRLSTDKKGNRHWSSASVYLEHKVVDVGTWQENLGYFKSKSLSLAELEKITGQTFYPLLKKKVPAEEYTRIKTSDPKLTGWWWK